MISIDCVGSNRSDLPLATFVMRNLLEREEAVTLESHAITTDDMLEGVDGSEMDNCLPRPHQLVG